MTDLHNAKAVTKPLAELYDRRIVMRCAKFLVIATLSGCASFVEHSTPTALRANSASTAHFNTSMGYDEAYKKTVEQMQACFEREAKYLKYTVAKQQSANEAEVSWALVTALSYKVLSTIVLNPTASGTKVTLYSAIPTQPDPLYAPLQSWLTKNGTGCPGDSPK